jgi:hypothetical protein
LAGLTGFAAVTDPDKMVNIRPHSRLVLPFVAFEQVGPILSFKKSKPSKLGMYDYFEQSPNQWIAVLQVGMIKAWVRLPNLMDSGVYYVWSGVNASGSLTGKPIDEALPSGLACFAKQAAARCQMDLPVFYSMLRKVCHQVDALFGLYSYCTAFHVIAALALKLTNYHLTQLQPSAQLVTVWQTVAGVLSRDCQRLKDAAVLGVASAQQVRSILSSIVLASSSVDVLHQLAINTKI